MSALAITAIVLCALGVLACFVPRLPGVVLSYAGMSCAWFAGAPYIDGSVLVFWFVAAVLVVGIGIFTPRRDAVIRSGNPYVTVGGIAGALLGYVAAPTSASIISGSALGAVLGALAFRSTPAGRGHLPVFSPTFINFLCDTGLRAVVSCSICGITAASVL